MPVTEQLLYSTGDAARLLGIGKSKFYQMNSTGELGPRPVLLGGKKMWAVDEMRRWIKAGCPVRDRWQKVKDA